MEGDKNGIKINKVEKNQYSNRICVLHVSQNNKWFFILQVLILNTPIHYCSFIGFNTSFFEELDEYLIIRWLIIGNNKFIWKRCKYSY